MCRDRDRTDQPASVVRRRAPGRREPAGGLSQSAGVNFVLNLFTDYYIIIIALDYHASE